MSEQAFVPQVDESPGANLERKVGAFESITLDGDLEVIVSVRFPLQGCTYIGRGVPRKKKLENNNFIRAAVLGANISQIFSPPFSSEKKF